MPTLHAAALDHGESIASGTLLGRYAVVRAIGRGSHGHVVAARDLELDRAIAIKFLFGALDPRVRQRLQHEAKALARLSHPNVCRVHDVGEHDGRLYMVMELIDGPTLATWAAGPRSTEDILAVMIAAGRGLAAAHAAGIVHRDFKPANVLIGSDGRPRVTDFGQARGHVPEPTASSLGGVALVEATSLDVTVTRSGEWLGTPAYMAAEIFEGGDADARADQFSFCVALYELLFGERPFAGDTVLALADNVLAGRVRMPARGAVRPDGRRIAVPTGVRGALLRGLQRDREARFASMDALLDAITRPRSRRPLQLVAALAVAAVGGGLAGAADPASAPHDWCGEVDRRIDGLWNPERERAIEGAIAATGLPWADDVTARLRGVIAPYVDELRSSERSSCEAQTDGSLVGEPAAARMLCLHRRHEELRGLLDLLERADAALVEHALQAADALPPIAACSDARTQGPRWTAADETAIYELDTAISRARISAEAWRDDAASAQAHTVIERAAALGQPWYEAEGQLLLARLLDRGGDTTAAESHFDGAFSAALAAEHHRVATAAAFGLASVLAGRGDHTNALRWIEHATAASERAGVHDPELAVELDMGRGQIAYHHGDYATALVHFETVLAALDGGSRRAGPVLLDIGICLANLGRYPEAIVALRRSLVAEEQAFGTGHPGLLRPLNAMCHVETDLGEIDASVASCQRAIDILRASRSGPQPRLSSLYTNLGSAYFHGGRFDEAEHAHLAALDNAERAQPDDATLLATIHNNLGVLYGERRELDRAQQHYRLAHRLLGASLGADHPSTAMIETNLAIVLTQAARYDEAEALLSGSLTRMAARLGDDHVDLALSYAELARIHVAKGDHAGAVPLFERAWALREAAGGDPIELADSSWGLAQSLEASMPGRQRVRVRALVRQAALLYRGVGGERLARADEVEQWLASLGAG
jgi:eukaryotic-like serine/threonine-protein kinase